MNFNLLISALVSSFVQIFQRPDVVLMSSYINLMLIPICFGVIAISFVAYAFFNAISRNPTLLDEASNKLFILVGVIEGSILACLGLGYMFVSSANSKYESITGFPDSARIEAIVKQVGESLKEANALV